MSSLYETTGHSESHPLGDIPMMHVLLCKENEQSPGSSPRVSESWSQDAHLTLYGSKYSWFSTTHALWTELEPLWKFLLLLCHFSEAHFPLLQLRKRPAVPASDLLCLIAFGMTAVPFQHWHGLLPSTQCGTPRGAGRLVQATPAECFFTTLSPNSFIGNIAW